MAQKVAVVVCKETMRLDSRFMWTSSLTSVDISEIPAVIFHSSVDSEETMITCLRELISKYPDKKYIYVNDRLSPLLTLLFTNAGGDIYSDESIFGDLDVLITLIDCYNDNDFRVAEPLKEFESFEKTIHALLNSDTPSSKIVEIANSADWRTQVASAVQNMGTALVKYNKASTEMVQYIDTVRGTISNLRTEYNKVTDELKSALAQNEKLAEASINNASGNKINNFAGCRIPMFVQRLLYISDPGNCPFLLTALLAYAAFLRTRSSKKVKLLIIEKSCRAMLSKYEKSGKFFILNSTSCTSPNIRDKTEFVTFDPKKNIFDAFFSCESAEDEDNTVFIVLDRFRESLLLNLTSGRSLKLLYAVTGTSMMTAFDIKPSKAIRAFTGDPESYVIPYVPNVARATTVQSRNSYLYQSPDMKKLYKKLNGLLSIDDCQI